jgi:hypothetical protein
LASFPKPRIGFLPLWSNGERVADQDDQNQSREDRLLRHGDSVSLNRAAMEILQRECSAEFLLCAPGLDSPSFSQVPNLGRKE